MLLRLLLEVEKGVLRSGLLAHLLVCAALADVEGCVVLNKLQLVTGRVECKRHATYHPLRRQGPFFLSITLWFPLLCLTLFALRVNEMVLSEHGNGDDSFDEAFRYGSGSKKGGKDA